LPNASSLFSNLEEKQEKTWIIFSISLVWYASRSNNKTWLELTQIISPEIHSLSYICLWHIGISSSLQKFYDDIENCRRCNRKLANCSLNAIINQHHWLMNYKNHCAFCDFPFFESNNFFDKRLRCWRMKEKQAAWWSNESKSKQLLCNKSHCEGKLFPILKLSDNQSLLNATVSFYDFLLESKVWRVRRFMQICVVKDINHKICVGNWANKQFVTQWHKKNGLKETCVKPCKAKRNIVTYKKPDMAINT
jgi:hypothetical protein